MVDANPQEILQALSKEEVSASMWIPLKQTTTRCTSPASTVPYGDGYQPNRHVYAHKNKISSPNSVIGIMIMTGIYSSPQMNSWRGQKLQWGCFNYSNLLKKCNLATQTDNSVHHSRSRVLYPFPRSHLFQICSNSHLQMGTPQPRREAMETRKRRMEQYFLKTLNMMHPSEDEKDAPSASKKPTIPIFTEVPSLIPAKFKFWLNNLDLDNKPFNDSLVSPDSVEVL